MALFKYILPTVRQTTNQNLPLFHRNGYKEVACIHAVKPLTEDNGTELRYVEDPSTAYLLRCGCICSPDVVYQGSAASGAVSQRVTVRGGAIEALRKRKPPLYIHQQLMCRKEILIHNWKQPVMKSEP